MMMNGDWGIGNRIMIHFQGSIQLETFKVFATLYGFADSIRQITTCIGLPIIFLESYSSIGQSAASIVTYIKEGEIS